MLKWLRNLIRESAPPRANADLFGGRGGFQGARMNRLTEGFNPGAMGPNALVKMDGAMLRNRARDLYRNNPMAKSAIDSWVANVIETGITPSPKFADVSLRKTWRETWERWGRRDCDVTRQSSIYELQALALSEMLVAGGCLVHHVELPRRGRVLPYAIELIPEERFTDQLDRNQSTGNPVYNGVEVDGRTGEPVAYWVTRGSAYDDASGRNSEPIRLPAEQCDYLTIRHMIGQYRGFSALHSAITWLWALGHYTDNELTASQLKSSWAYMVTTSGESAEDFDWQGLYDSSPDSGTTDIYGNRIEKHQAGMIWRGAPGDDIKPVGPNMPSMESLPWIQMLQRSIAIGTGQTYEEAFADYSQGSFASTRASSQSVRRRFRPVQKLMNNHFNAPIYERFAKSAVRAGLEGFPSADEFVADTNWLRCEWQPSQWDSVNPIEDSKADSIDLLVGRKSLREVVEGRRDLSLEEHLDELAEEQEMIRARGIVLPTWTEQMQEQMYPDGQEPAGDTAKKPATPQRRAA